MSFVSIDVSGITTKKQLHQLLMEKLNFPGFYGMNWDAFRDTITGLVEMPDQLEIFGFDHLKQILPRDAELLSECLNEYNEFPNLKKIEIQIK